MPVVVVNIVSFCGYQEKNNRDSNYSGKWEGFLNEQ